MILTITRAEGDLKREEWTFALVARDFSLGINFESYFQQGRRTKRCRTWTTRAGWIRLERKGSWHLYKWVDNPPLPPDVEAEMRTRFQEEIAKTPIVR